MGSIFVTARERTGSRAVVLILLASGALASCSQDNPSVTPPQAEEDAQAGPTGPAAASSNACPVDGCSVSFQNVEDSGEELKLSFTSNYAPDNSGNHYHVYWGKFEAKQVSNDAETKYKVKQGEWEPTSDNPFTTTGAVAAGQRGDSTKICVTPGDKNHNVINPAVVECRDVANLL